jgi:hypothetical protein
MVFGKFSIQFSEFIEDLEFDIIHSLQNLINLSFDHSEISSNYSDVSIDNIQIFSQLCGHFINHLFIFCKFGVTIPSITGK